MSDEQKPDNPADIAAELIRKRAAEQGYELVEDFDEHIAEWRDYLDEPIWSDEVKPLPNKIPAPEIGEDEFPAELEEEEYGS
jgi:hypothetical protein